MDDGNKPEGPKLVTTLSVPQEIIVPPGKCSCGCGGNVNGNAKFIKGHNVRVDINLQRQLAGKGFQPGKSGNPRGRKKKPVTSAMEALMNERYPGDPRGRTGAELLAIAVFREAVQGNITAAVEITNRVEGKAQEMHTHQHEHDMSENVHDRLRELVNKLRGNPMAASGPATRPPGDQPSLSDGAGGVSVPSGAGVHPEAEG